MYLADNNDTLPTREHRQEVLDYFNTRPGGGSTFDWNPEESGEPNCHRAHQWNPYLRWPVVLDEYTKNRDVWNCPSAKLENGATAIIGSPDWLSYLQAWEGTWGKGGSAGWCGPSFPAGWGGAITDTCLQDTSAMADTKHFRLSIGTRGGADLKLVSVQDPVSYPICGDGGAVVFDMTPAVLAWPDICALECSGNRCDWVDWELIASGGCDWAADCYQDYAPNNGAFIADPTLRKPFTRHLGGVNVGYLDGHASWINSDSLINKVKEGDTDLESWYPTSEDAASVYECYPDALFLL